MAESKEYIKDDSENEEVMNSFIKKFIKLKPAEAKELRQKLEALDLMKMREEYVAKIIDLLPDNQEDLNKIFNDTGLDEDETKKILDTVKEFK